MNKITVLLAAMMGLGVMGLGLSPDAFGGKDLYGTASWYSEKDRRIRRLTANGEVFDDSKKTCAAWNLKFGTRLKVTNLKNGKSVVCRVNDRGPAKKLKNRVVDLSRAAFHVIADPKLGLVPIKATPMKGVGD